jgi:hypothetical protein
VAVCGPRSSVLFLLLSLYTEQVVPNEWGTKKPFFFCFLPSYWSELFRRKQAYADLPEDGLPPADEGGDEDRKEVLEEITEAQRAQMRDGQCLQIRGLTKHFQVRPTRHGFDARPYSQVVAADGPRPVRCRRRMASRRRWRASTSPCSRGRCRPCWATTARARPPC